MGVFFGLVTTDTGVRRAIMTKWGAFMCAEESEQEIDALPFTRACSWVEKERERKERLESAPLRHNST